MATLRVRVSAPARHDYHAPAPGKARNRWGCYRRGYPVRFDGGIGVFLGLVPLPTGPDEEARDARDYARRYGRDCYVAMPTPWGWERYDAHVDAVSPPGDNPGAGSVPAPGPIVVRL